MASTARAGVSEVRPGPGQGPVLPPDLSFDTVCSFFEVLTSQNGDKPRKGAAARRKIIGKFIDTCIVRSSGQAYAVFRLVLPAVRGLNPVHRSRGSVMAEGQTICISVWEEGAAGARPSPHAAPQPRRPRARMQLDSERGSYRLQEGKLVKLLLKACGVARDGMAAKAARDWKKPGVKGVGEFARVMQEVRKGEGGYVERADSCCEPATTTRLRRACRASLGRKLRGTAGAAVPKTGCAVPVFELL